MTARLVRIQWMLAGVLLLGGAVLLLAVYRPLTGRLSDLSMQIGAKQRQLELNQSRAQNLPKVAAEVDELRRRLDQYKKLPSHADIGQFHRDISAFAAQYGLESLSVAPQPAKHGELFNELPVELKFSGPFSAVIGFLGETERMPRLARVKSLDVRSLDPGGGEGRVSVSISMDIYFADAL